MLSTIKGVFCNFKVELADLGKYDQRFPRNLKGDPDLFDETNKLSDRIRLSTSKQPYFPNHGSWEILFFHKLFPLYSDDKDSSQANPTR